MEKSRVQLRTVVACVGIMLMVAAPAVGAAFDAKNADKVDGKHAVGSKASNAKAKGKLVATGKNGKFAPKFIPKVGAATNADKLGGVSAADYARDLGNVVTVAKSGGDFTSVQAAIDSITDATLENPYLVFIGPGIFEGRVVMKPDIGLQGVGQATRIRAPGIDSADPELAAVLVGERRTTLRSLAIQTPGPGRPVGIYQETGSLAMKDVFVTVEGATTGASFGAVIDTANIFTMDVEFNVLNFEPAGDVFGVQIQGGILDMRSSRVVAIGSTAATAVSILEGINTVTVRGSELTGSQNGLLNLDGGPEEPRIAHSEVSNAGGPGGVVCVGAFNSSFAALDEDCLVPGP